MANRYKKMMYTSSIHSGESKLNEGIKRLSFFSSYMYT